MSFSLEKEWDYDTAYNLDETWRHYANWQKPGTNTVWFHPDEIISAVKFKLWK